MVIHQLVVNSFNKILLRLKSNAVESTLEPHCSTYYTLFPLGDTLLLLNSYRREGVHPKLPGVRGLLGVRLPVDVPVAPCFREFIVYVFYAYAVSDILSLI